MFLVLCKCSKDLKLPDKYADKKVRCPYCKRVIVIPPLEARRASRALPPMRGERTPGKVSHVADSDTAVMQAEVVEEEPAASASASGSRVLLVLAALVLLFLAGGGAVAALLIVDPFSWFSAPADSGKDTPLAKKQDDKPKDDPNVKLTRFGPRYRLEHDAEVRDVAISPDGQWIATAGEDAGILWDAGGKEKAKVGKALSLTFAPDSKQLAISRGSRIWFWDIDKGAVEGSEILEIGSDALDLVRFTPDGNSLTVVCSTGMIKLFDPKAREYRTRLGEKRDRYREYTFAAAGEWLVAVSDTAMDLWHLPTQTRKKRFNDVGFKTEPFYAGLAGSPTEPLIAAGHGHHPDPFGQLTDLTTTAEKLKLTSSEPLHFSSMAFSPDGKWLATGLGAPADGDNHPVQLWNVATGKSVIRLDGPHGAVTRLAFSRDMTRLAAASKDNRAYVWDLTRAKWD